MHTLLFRQWRFTRYLWIIGGLLFLAVYVVGDYGILQIYFKIREVHELRNEIARLEEEHIILLQQKTLLEDNDRDFIEKIAREKFGMVKDGETLYKVIIEKDAEKSLDKENSLPDTHDQKIP
jgi:cell division protein FtsB